MDKDISKPFANKTSQQPLDRYHLISDSLLITTLDSQGTITSVNPLVERITGWCSEELVGNSWDQIFLTGEDSEETARISEKIRSGQAFQIQAQFEAKSGSRKAVLWDSLKVRGADSKDGQIVAIGKEVAQNEDLKLDVRQEWEMLTDIVNNMGAGLNLLNEKRRILWTNTQMAEWFGNGGLVGSYCNEILHPREHSMSDCPSFYTFRTKKPGFKSSWVTTADGKKRFFQFITTPVFNEASEVTYILELIIDITTRKEIEERRVESEKMATIGELANAVAHEIRNPMTVIGGFTRRLKEKVPENPLVQDTVDVILKESRRLEDMVLKVNLFLNPKETTYTQGHVNELLSQTLKAMQKDFEVAAVEVNTRFNQDIPPQRIDSNNVRHVFFNIFQNALDAMPEGGTVTITSSVKGEFAEVRIHDTGPGIKKEDVGSIFHVFFSTKESGLGLGLAIASQIVHDHGGYINVEPGSDDQGATFVVGLPLYPDDSSKKD